MSTSSRRFGRVATVAAIGSALTVLAATPAFAAVSQWPYCDHFETGWTRWYADPKYDQIVTFYGVWENRNGNFVESQDQQVAVSGGSRLRIYGEGNSHWALAGVVIEASYIYGRGVGCEGANVDSNIVNTLPLGTMNSLPPLPALALVPEVEQVT